MRDWAVRALSRFQHPNAFVARYCLVWVSVALTLTRCCGVVDAGDSLTDARMANGSV